MGMFDYVSKNVSDRIINMCPNCATDLTEYSDNWQTKDFECLLDTLNLEDFKLDKFEMNHICPECNRFIKADVDFSSGTVTVFIENTSEQKLLFHDLTICEDRLRLLQQEIDKTLHSNNSSIIQMLKLNQSTESDLEKYRNLFDFDIIIDHLLDEYYVIPKKLKDV